MSTDPTNNFDMNNLDIDELASRLIDHDVELSDIPHELRAAVDERAAQFGENRQQMLTSLPLVDSSIMNNAVQLAVIGAKTPSKPRKLSMYIASFAAAAAIVAIVGVAVTRSSSSDQSAGDIAETAKISTDAMAAPMATEAPAEMSANSFAPMAADSALAGAKASLIISDTNELQDLVSEWSVEGFVVPQKSEPLCDDPLRPAIDVEATFAGQPAEIHFFVRDGIVVYRLDTCDMMGGIVP
jgi:hypothetical protein